MSSRKDADTGWMLRYLAGGVAAGKASFDGKTGHFLAPNGGWAVTHQDIVFPLALLFRTPGTRYHGDSEVLELCARGGDAWRDWQDAEGRFEFIKTDGSRWGMAYMPWSIYHWLEAYVLLRDELGSARRKRWERGLTLAYDGLMREHETPRAHNIPTWNGMSLVRGGQVFNRPDWAETGRKQVLFSAAAQHPHGFWPEGDGPTNGYNTVYVHALGLYYLFTRDRTVVAPLRRATDFHSTFVYPDGSSIETIDGRQKYAPGAHITGWPGFSLFPKGRRLLRLWGEALRRESRGRLVPHLASGWQHACADAEAPIPLDDAAARVVYKRSALVRRHGPWVTCVSGYAPRPESRPWVSRSRWIMTRANCLSVWHEKLGLLIGGGNSKEDPGFATFEVWQGTARRIEPDTVRFSRRDGRETVRLGYGGLAGVLHLSFARNNRLELCFELPAATARAATVQAGFTMRLATGCRLSWTHGARAKASQHATLDPLRTAGFSCPADAKGAPWLLSAKGWSLQMPTESTFSYPAYPFNPYAIDGASTPVHAVATVSVTFETARTKRFVLRAD